MSTERVRLHMDDTETKQFFTGNDMVRTVTIDKMVRHKWPEEKPKVEKYYLVRCVNHNSWNEVVYWKGGCFFTDKRCLRKAFNEVITHWWNLPEVTE